MTGQIRAPHHASLVERLRAAGCVFAEDEATLLLDAADGADALERMVARRVSGEPLEHVLGWVDFDGLRLTVGAGVFVPRQRTVGLVDFAEIAVRQVVRHGSAPVVVDLCCGCAAVGAALAHRLAGSRVGVDLHATDVDQAAVACAQTNLADYDAQVYTGDLYGPLPHRLRGTVDVIVANVPYVPTSAIALMPPEARDHEHRLSIDGGADGLNIARRLVGLAPGWLAPGGVVMFECDAGQADAAAALVQAAGLVAAVRDDADRDVTIVMGTHA